MGELIHIYRATRGRYKKPIPFSESGIHFVNEDYEKVPPPSKHPCEHPKHWEWGKGTRNGQKLYYPLNEMFVQKYHLTRKELIEASKQFDMASLEMKGMIICKDCAEKESKK